MGILVPIAWLISIFYGSVPLFWLPIHALASRWQKMKRSPYRILLPIWAGIIGALALVTWPWHSVQIYSVAWAWLAALPFFAFGIKIYRGIRSGLGMARFAGLAELRPYEHNQALIVVGMHGRMRHPIYVAHSSMLAGWAIGSGLAVGLLLLAISVAATFPFMIWIEEKELELRFGESYRQYKRQVPLLPFLNFRSDSPSGSQTNFPSNFHSGEHSS